MMDDYPRFSLDHNVPLLVTLGVPSEESPYTIDVDPALRTDAVPIGSQAPSLDSDQARDLLSYILDRDASDLPWNGHDAAVKYRFRVRTAERVCWSPPGRGKITANVRRHYSYLRVKRASPRTSSRRNHLSSYTPPTRP